MKFLFTQTVLNEKIQLWILKQFHYLLANDFKIIDILTLLQETQKNSPAERFFYQMKKALQSGLSFSMAAQEQIYLFDPMARQLIILGEESGRLADIFKILVEWQEKNMIFKNNIKKSCRYPCFLIGSALLITWMMFLWIIPNFQSMFMYSTQSLPWITRLIFACSSFVNKYNLFLCTVLFGFCLIAWRFKHFLIPFLVKLPGLSSLQRKLFEVKFARNLSLLLSSGMPLLDGLRLLLKINLNPAEKNLLQLIEHRLTQGNELYTILHSLNEFSNFFKQLIRAGQEAKELPAMLNQAANWLDRELSDHLSLIQEFIEPLIMLIVGALIGIIVVSVYLPIFKLGTVIS